MKKQVFVLIAAVLFVSMPAYAAPVKVAASLPDLASIAANIGGDKVEVFSIAKGDANPHFVEVLPSYMIKVSRASVYLKAGLALDQWSDGIIDGARNNRLIVADCSRGIEVLQKPTGKVDASLGDVHSEGNPHYWLNPSNGIIIAQNVLETLKKSDSPNSAYYEKNYDLFKQELEKRIVRWRSQMALLSGQKIVGYHSSWVYFASAFNLVIAAYVEPLPGIPPTGRHLSDLVAVIKKENISILLQEPYFSDQAPRFLARQTGIRVIKASPSCDGVSRESYFAHFDTVVDALTGVR